MRSMNNNQSHCHQNGRYGPGEEDRIKILREGFRRKLAELKGQDKITYCMAVKEIIGEMEKMRLQMTNRALELSILSQQSNQLMETYNESMHHPTSRYAASISSFSAFVDRPTRTMDISYRTHLSGHPLQPGNLLPRIQEELLPARRNGFGLNELSQSRLNGDRPNTSGYQSLFPPSHPTRKFRAPVFMNPSQDRGERINSSINLLPMSSKERKSVRTLLSSAEPAPSRGRSNDDECSDKVVFEVTTRKSPPMVQSSDLLDAVSECDSIEEITEEEDQITVVNRRISQSSVDTSKSKKSSNQCKPLPQRKNGKTNVAEFILKKWSVALKGGDLLLVGKQCDKQGRVIDDNHKTSIVQKRKLDGSIQTKNGVYVLEGAPSWTRPTDPPTPIKKMFDKKFPSRWRQAGKFWKLKLSKEKKTAKCALKLPPPTNHAPTRKKSRESSYNDSDDEPSAQKQSKKNPEPSATKKTAKSKKTGVKEIKKERTPPSEKPNLPALPKKKQASSAANKVVQPSEIQTKKKTKNKKTVAKNVDEVNDCSETEEYDPFDQLDLVVPKIGIPAMTPNTFCKALAKNEVRIGAHTPTLKTFVDEHRSDSIAVTPLPGPSKPKKCDVIAMRMAKAIKSGNEPSGTGKTGKGTSKKENGVKKANTAVNANKEAIDEIISKHKKTTGGSTPNIIRKIREGLDDSDTGDESEIESSETDSD